MVDWTIFDGVQLIAYTLFVFWQPFPMKRKEVEWYRGNVDKFKGVWTLARVPSGVFPVVWMCLYICIVAGITLFAKWTVDADHWVWRTVYSLFFVNVLVSKSWTWLFFTKRQFMLSLMNGIFLAATAVAMVVCVGVGHDNITEMYYVPLILFIVYATWLCYAIFLTIAWWVNMPEESEKPARFFTDVVQGMTKDQLRMSRAIGHVPVAFAETGKGK